MSDTKWVQHFSGQGEKFKLEQEWENVYEILLPKKDGGDMYADLPKSEYRPCPPPERWEVVPLDSRLRLNKNARSFCIPDLFENERFAIKDGALVLERRVG